MNHLTASWAVLATMGETTFWHVTRDQDFKIDPGHRPASAPDEFGRDLGGHPAGLFVTHNPELWRMLWLPTGPAYAAEVECSAGDAQRLGVDGDDRDQWFIPSSRLSGVKVLRTVPVDVAIKETRKQGQGFALLIGSDQDSLVHVIDHRKGFGTIECLCGAWAQGAPLKWSTKEYVLKEMSAHPDICPECLAKLKRQRT